MPSPERMGADVGDVLELLGKVQIPTTRVMLLAWSTCKHWLMRGESHLYGFMDLGRLSKGGAQTLESRGEPRLTNPLQ